MDPVPINTQAEWSSVMVNLPNLCYPVQWRKRESWFWANLVLQVHWILHTVCLWLAWHTCAYSSVCYSYLLNCSFFPPWNLYSVFIGKNSLFDIYGTYLHFFCTFVCTYYKCVLKVIVVPKKIIVLAARYFLHVTFLHVWKCVNI